MRLEDSGNFSGLRYADAQLGMTLVELLVAMAIGLGITLAVTSLLIMGENHKRTTTSTNDAEQTGVFGQPVNEPDGRNLREKRADERNQLAGEEEPVVAMAQGAEDAVGISWTVGRVIRSSVRAGHRERALLRIAPPCGEWESAGL